MTISKLPTSASLKQVMDKFEEISLQDFSSIDIITASELPSNGKEGQLCIITNYEPNSIYLSVEKPSLQEKDIYIKIHTEQTKEVFNIEDSNKILKLNLMDITQVQDGVENFLSGYIRINQEWVRLTPLEIHIFTEGVGDITDTTGGYAKYTFGTYPSYGDSNIRLISSYIQVMSCSDSNTNLGYARMISMKSINVTPFSKLYVEVSYYMNLSTNGKSTCKVGLGPSISNNSDFVTSYSFTGSNSVSRRIIEIDVSNLNGEYHFKATSDAGSYMGAITIYNAWLEV